MDNFEKAALAALQIDNPAMARAQEQPAAQKARAATMAREQAEAYVAACEAEEKEGAVNRAFLYDRTNILTASINQRLDKTQYEILTLRESCDAASYAHDIRRDQDTLDLYMTVYTTLVERLMGLHKLNTAEARAALDNCKATEAEALAVLSHLRTVMTLEDAYNLEGRIGFVGEQTSELMATARQLYARAERSENTAREMRAAYEKQQTALTNVGILTSANVRHAIGRR